MHRPADAAFAFRDLHDELGGIAGPASAAAAAGPLVHAGKQPEWHTEFARFQHAPPAAAGPMDMAMHAEFDAAFQSAREQHAQHQAAPQWASEFDRFAAAPAPPVHLTAEDTAALDRAFEQARESHDTASWADQYATANPTTGEAWAEEFAATASDRESLARTAGELLEAVGAQADGNPKFSNSEFMKFMTQLRDREVEIEGDKVVNGSSAARDAEWATEFEGRSDDYVESMWAKEFGGQFMGNEADWAEDFDFANGPSGLLGDDTQWSKEFERLARGDPTLSAWNLDLPEYAQYEFEPANPFVRESIERLRQLPLHEMPLAEAILALEARVSMDPDDARAWALLGIKQQENERERQAISALRRALERDQAQQDAWIALSVSYTNEGHPEPALDSLRQWIAHSPTYAHLMTAVPKTDDSFADVSALYLEAAAMGGEVFDADVQIGLGVLFNVSEEYDKAADCFRAALGARPDDYLLWNKLGATLANSHDASRAMDAYFHALAINPSYIRARYNLAIACINQGQHREAAHHLLESLALQSSDAGGGGSGPDAAGGVTSGFASSGVWDTLRMACLLMNKDTWATMCSERNYPALRAAFEQEQ
ncbi:hypothetical protein BC828DRAFT_397727 [Blastocladiella britannica]|nr:hypothetical protein BC828DRAFT_397727 [Blastocladiella britannica]